MGGDDPGRQLHVTIAADDHVAVLEPGRHMIEAQKNGGVTPCYSLKNLCGGLDFGRASCNEVRAPCNEVSVAVGLEPLDRAQHLGLSVGSAHPIGGLDELPWFEILVVHEEVFDGVQFEG